MLIDWFTVVAQALNFVILVWLLKRFLYKPILNAIDAREQRIASELAAADAKQAEAQKERDTFQAKNEEFDKQRASLMSKAEEDAKTERQRLLDEARKAAVALTAKRQEALQNEEHSLHQALEQRTQQEVFAIARKTLTDLGGIGMEERMVAAFVRKLGELNPEQKGLLVSTLKTLPNPPTVRTAFDLPPAQRASVEGAIKETLGTGTQVRFETVPELIGGIALIANGQKVAWDISDYLTSLKEGIGELLKENGEHEA